MMLVANLTFLLKATLLMPLSIAQATAAAASPITSVT
jgi:hypothetical protein